MFDEGFQDVGGDGGDVGADEGGFLDVVHGADGGGQDVGCEVLVIVVDRADFADDVHAVEADVVQAADEGRHERGAGFGGQ